MKNVVDGADKYSTSLASGLGAAQLDYDSYFSRKNLYIYIYKLKKSEKSN